MFNLPSPDLLPPTTITIPFHTPPLDVVTLARESPPIIPPPKASLSSGGDFLGVPYSLPSGITFTVKTVSRREEPTAFLLLKNLVSEASSRSCYTKIQGGSELHRSSH
ncbi:hypothetical protein LIER_35216 [Lithospermum erythrorhizon]|uniref:Uncharacterized protein n=1 Tax=Lithospermum erythrorhizon TaxID=34254 RepID=A0AAV3NLW1_LITER